MAHDSHSPRDAEYSAPSSEHSLFTNAPLGIIISNPEGRLFSVNPAMARTFGYNSPDELIESIKGDTTQLYADPSDREVLIRLLRENDEVQNYECRGVHRDGFMIWTSMNVSAVRDDNGEIIHFQCFITDITERKCMEESLRRERDLSQRYLDTTQTMMVALDAEGRITMINRAGRELLGYAEEEILGCHWFETCLPQPEGVEIVYPGFLSIMAGDLESFEYFENSVLCRDGTQRRMGWHNAFLEDDLGRVVGTLSSGEDITERRQAEEALRESEQRFRQWFESSPISLWEQDFSAIKERIDEIKAHNGGDLDSYFRQRPELVRELAEMVRVLDVNQASLNLYRAASKEEFFEGITKVFSSESWEGFLQVLLVIAAGEKTFVTEKAHATLDGEPLKVQLYWAVAQGHEETYSRVLVSIVDITQRNQTEEELRERKAWLDLFFSQALSGTFFVMLDEPIEWNAAADKEGLLDYAMTHLRTTWVNQAMLDQYGASEEDFIGLTAEDMFAHDLEQFRDTHRRLFDNGRLRLETRERRRDGTPIIIEGDYISMYDDHGRITGFFGVQSDITQRKQAEEALRESEERFRSVLENLPGGIFAHDLDGRIVLVNDQASRNTGYSREELLRMTVWDLDPYASTRDDQTTIWQRLETGESITIESNHIRKDGTHCPVEVHLNAITLNEQFVILPVAFDISWRKHFEQALRESEQQFRTLFMESPVSITILDKDDGEIIDANLQAYTAYGLSSVEELKARGMFMEPPYSYAEALAWIRKAATEGPQQFEWLNRDVYGKLFWEQVRLIPITINGVGRVVATTVDITELKETMDALHQSENYYRAIFETSGSAMFIIEDDTTISLVNSNFEELSGYSGQEMEGKMSWTDFAHPDDVEWMKENHYLRREDPGGAPRQYEFRFMNRHEEERNVLLAVDMIPGTSRSIASCVDITQRKQMEEKLKEISFRDSLTGLYNRNFFEEELARLGNGRHNPVGIVVCDLDGLKFVNDTLGHQSGDQLLVQAAAILRQNFRSSDILARIGGDEFAALLAETNSEMVEEILQRLRQAVHDHNNLESELPLSLSMGYALDEGGTTDMQALFREADNRMYREKLQREGSARSAILQALTVSMKARDFNTENHCDRLQELAVSLARSLNLSQDFVNDLYLLARFHDLGKVGMPDHILFKPGPLTEEEWRQMRQHCEIGHRIASSVPDLEPIADWILKHHECWDGRGYPLGLTGQDIPLPCRILAIADAYDAMTSDRPYRKAMTFDGAMEELRRCAGTQFDPELVGQFIHLLQEHDL